MKLAHALLALALTGSTGAACAATPGYLGTLSGSTISIGNSFAAGVAIRDTYTFDILQLSAVAATAVSIEFDVPQLPGREFAIDDFKIAFYDPANFLLASDMPSGPGDTLLQLGNLLLAAGAGYQFVVSGNVTGTLGGSYGGALAAAPIPEAETYALMLVGLAALVALRTRRQAARST